LKCGQNTGIEKKNKPDAHSKDWIDHFTTLDKNTIEHVNIPYFVGDINNDSVADTAFVNYDQRLGTDGTIEKECVNHNCNVTIKFNQDIPDLVIHQSLSVFIQNTGDLNGDNANEILLFSLWQEGFWNKLSVCTFKNGKWQEIAQTKAFLSEDKDFESRITKIKSQFYLIGDGWNDSKGGINERSIKIAIEK